MKTPQLLAPLALAAAFLAWTPRAADLGYHPAAGTSVTRTIESIANSVLEDMSMSMNGQEMDPSQMGEMEVEARTTTNIVVTDEVTAVSGGRPTKLKRTFDSLASETATSASHAMMGDMSTDVSSKSELEGATVVFTWSDDAGDYQLAFDEGSSGDDDLLAGLIEDMDLRAFLPDGEVEEGATWELEPESMRGIIAPGGALKLEAEEGSEMPMGMGQSRQPTPDEALGEIDGEVSAEFAGYEEVDGVRVALIRLKYDVSSSKDMTEWMQETMENMETPMPVEMDVESFDMELAYSGEGELRWNVEKGIAHSLSLSGEQRNIIDTAMSLQMGDQTMEMENSMEMGGEFTFTLSVEAAD